MNLHRPMAKRAAEAGLGNVRRLHRQHRGRPDWTGLAPWLLGSAMVAAVAAAFDWRYVLLLPPLLAAGLACWAHLAPPGLDGPRRWFAVCDDGLLVWSRGSAPIAIPWGSLTTPEWGARSVRRLVWTDGTAERSVLVGPVTAARDLGRAVERREPVRASLRPRLAAGAVGAATLALVRWIVQPWLVPAVLGERPERLRDLARLCWRQDRPFERAAEHGGTGPHPLVLFRDGIGSSEPVTAGRDGKRPAPDEVQLVACSYEAGRVSDEPIQVCPYEGGLRVETYQGRHRLDVYEARTGRRVGRRMMTGPAGTDECAPVKFVRGEPPYDDVLQDETVPSLSDYRTALRPFIQGP
ncbi:hypothetical protein [Actinomadura bangladeshensis]|uniref:Uncharacterized protein n=1 Tax=Actinomadura bangladeshensis TaxID=453573 RepID=A0A4R4NVZ0_9ACTN|nr:hypothetical protein [Actinomadura bangladeshensis]TDC13639.1 hypothetical protein E1284_19590 [Actinomadura bangladeshensis]